MSGLIPEEHALIQCPLGNEIALAGFYIASDYRVSSLTSSLTSRFSFVRQVTISHNERSSLITHGPLLFMEIHLATQLSNMVN